MYSSKKQNAKILFAALLTICFVLFLVIELGFYRRSKSNKTVEIHYKPVIVHKSESFHVHKSESFYPQNVLIPLKTSCPLQLDDAFILQTGVRSVDHRVSSIICNQDNQELTKKLISEGKNHEDRYRERNSGCSASNGMWWKMNSADQKCFLLNGFEYMNIPKVHDASETGVILDWGAGCGWQLFWIYKYYGYLGFGLDLIKENAEYAKQNYGLENKGFIVDYCPGDATDLDYITDDVFDHILAIAAVYHLPEEAQCQLVTEEFVRVVKKGGKIWLGWHNGDGMTKDKWVKESSWKKCLDDYNKKAIFGSIEYEIVNEIETFGYAFYGTKTSYSVIITKN